MSFGPGISCLWESASFSSSPDASFYFQTIICFVFFGFRCSSRCSFSIIGSGMLRFGSRRQIKIELENEIRPTRWWREKRKTCSWSIAEDFAFPQRVVMTSICAFLLAF